MGQPIRGTLADTYLRHRGVTPRPESAGAALPFPVLLRANGGTPREAWPALLAAITDLNGTITGVHRT